MDFQRLMSTNNVRFMSASAELGRRLPNFAGPTPYQHKGETSMGRPPLTDKEERVYEFINSYMSRFGRPPTYAEIRDRFRYKNNSSIQNFIQQLRLKGYIKAPIGSNKKRAIELVAKGRIRELERIPLEGTVAAGGLTEAVHHRDYVDVPRNLLRSGGEYFALRVKGDSMIEDCIMSGDLVIIRRQSNAQNGQTVVALVDNSEATIKRYYKKEDHIELVPANPSYDLIRVDHNTEFKILGVLTSVIRKLE